MSIADNSRGVSSEEGLKGRHGAMTRRLGSCVVTGASLPESRRVRACHSGIGERRQVTVKGA